MSFKFIKALPTPEDIRTIIPMTDALKEAKKKRDAEIADVLTGKSDKFLLVIGPCSADSEEPVIEYINRLKPIADKVYEKIIIIPRIYTNKPRTTGEGYKGIIHQPDPEGDTDFEKGLLAMRHMHVRAIRETGLTGADEMLYPDNWGYVSDMLSYVAVGARSVEDQQHRIVASGFDLPTGMKNPTSGDLSVLMNSITAAQGAHTFVYRGKEVETNGNSLAHSILRGSVNKDGRTTPNYHYEDIMRLLEVYSEHDLKNKACVIDTNHSNSGKKFKEQIRIAKDVMYSRNHNNDIRKFVKGLMIESYLVEGNQKISDHMTYGQSITDACLGFEDTEKLIFEIAESV
ncbi:MAG: 3-deoxy-7-phosphoheptulonate synthase [Lachnospiraceae bacterium]|nr:3-deoxy-7-phosphoheptulonate synthase [Lachnospiraceae bacterium]MDN4742144.1 3-deoxy-7-phosphoheptulonate synthase [Lachnospiraceae bacterium C1.1]